MRELFVSNKGEITMTNHERWHSFLIGWFITTVVVMIAITVQGIVDNIR